MSNETNSKDSDIPILLSIMEQEITIPLSEFYRITFNEIIKNLCFLEGYLSCVLRIMEVSDIKRTYIKSLHSVKLLRMYCDDDDCCNNDERNQKIDKVLNMIEEIKALFKECNDSIVCVNTIMCCFSQCCNAKAIHKNLLEEDNFLFKYWNIKLD